MISSRTVSHKILIVLLSLILVSSVASIYLDSSREAEKKTAFFQEQEAAQARGELTFAGPYCFPDRHPEKMILIPLLSFFALVGALVTSNRFILSLLSFSPIVVFIYWYYDTQRLLQGIESTVELEGFQDLIYRANGFDIAVLFLIIAVVVWQFIGALFTLVRTEDKKSTQS